MNRDDFIVWIKYILLFYLMFIGALLLPGVFVFLFDHYPLSMPILLCISFFLMLWDLFDKDNKWS